MLSEQNFISFKLTFLATCESIRLTGWSIRFLFCTPKQKSLIIPALPYKEDDLNYLQSCYALTYAYPQSRTAVVWLNKALVPSKNDCVVTTSTDNTIDIIERDSTRLLEAHIDFVAKHEALELFFAEYDLYAQTALHLSQRYVKEKIEEVGLEEAEAQLSPDIYDILNPFTLTELRHKMIQHIMECLPDPLR